MATEIQTAQDIWPQLSSVVFVPRTESDYQQLSTLREELIVLIGENENHPLVSLKEVVEALIEKYESEQESAEREAWYNLSMQMLARAYGEDEPEYTTDMLKWVIQIMKESDVILAPLPQADEELKYRPAIVIREMPIPYRDQVLVCGVSTNLNQYIQGFDDIISPTDADFMLSGLRSESLIRLSFLAVIPRRFVRGTIR